MPAKTSDDRLGQVHKLPAGDAAAAFRTALARADDGDRILITKEAHPAFSAHPDGVVLSDGKRLTLNARDVLYEFTGKEEGFDVDDESGTVVLAFPRSLRLPSGRIVYRGEYDFWRPVRGGAFVQKVIPLLDGKSRTGASGEGGGGGLGSLANKPAADENVTPIRKQAEFLMLIHCNDNGENPIGSVERVMGWLANGGDAVSQSGRSLVLHEASNDTGEKRVLYTHHEEFTNWARNANGFMINSSGHLWRNGTAKVCAVAANTQWAMLGPDAVVERETKQTGRALYLNGRRLIKTGPYVRWTTHKHGVVTETDAGEIFVTVVQAASEHLDEAAT